MDRDVEEQTDNTDNVMELSHEEKVKRAEIKLISFFVEHDIDFHVADKLILLLKDICRDSRIVQDFLPGQVKCAEDVIEEIILKREDKEIMNQCLQLCKFSILILEVYKNDRINNPYTVLIVLVRYVSPSNKKIVMQLFMHSVTSYSTDDSKRNEQFEIFKYVLEEKKIPIRNIVGLAYDNFYNSMSSVIVGSNSFMQHLKQEVPKLVTLNCICHSFIFVARKACENSLPVSCEILMNKIFTYSLNNVERYALLNDIYELFNLEKKLNFPWIVLENCVIKIVENWEDLQNYFAIVEDNSVELILSQLNNNIIKAHFLFLKYVLNLFNCFNALFQSSKILVHKLFESSQRIIHQLVQNFMTLDASIHNDLDVNNEEYILNLENIYLGSECEHFVKSLPLPDRQEVKLTGLNFYKEATQELLKRLPYRDFLVEYLTFLEPEIALYAKGRLKFRDLTYIAVIVEHNIDIIKLAYEWRILPLMFNEQQKKELACLEIDEMWSKIVECKNYNKEKIFPNLELLVEVVLSFPYSNAKAEQIFSDLEKHSL